MAKELFRQSALRFRTVTYRCRFYQRLNAGDNAMGLAGRGAMVGVNDGKRAHRRAKSLCAFYEGIRSLTSHLNRLGNLLRKRSNNG